MGLRENSGRIFRHSVLAIALCGAGCAESQMRYNILSYDNAIAQGANQQLLLNAVRASQHYPLSFTAMGQVLTSPAVGGNLQGVFSFSRLAGLTTYGVTPHLDATAGYGNFALDNLNYQGFMEAIRKPVEEDVLDTFRRNTRWPRGLLPLIHLQSFSPTEAELRTIDFERKRRCLGQPEGSLCSVLDVVIDRYTRQCDRHFVDIDIRLNKFRHERTYYYNSPRTFCNFARFQILAIEMRVLRFDACQKKRPIARCIQAAPRPPLEMIEYLGELIAAQNYIEEPFEPFLVVGDSTLTGDATFDIAPLFQVKRGIAGPGGVALAVIHEGENFYIPRPDFGSRREARSLQALDLVLATLRAATTGEKLPKLQTLGVVGTK